MGILIEAGKTLQTEALAAGVPLQNRQAGEVLDVLLCCKLITASRLAPPMKGSIGELAFQSPLVFGSDAGGLFARYLLHATGYISPTCICFVSKIKVSQDARSEESHPALRCSSPHFTWLPKA